MTTQKGIVIRNISNLYHVELNSKIYYCYARGKFKNDEISPVAGDIVQIEITQEDKNEGVINQIEKRNSYIKRPKMANITQIILVVSMKLPKPDLELLDKQIAYAEYNEIKPIICFNKIDLEKQETIDRIAKIYKDIGYTVIQTNAKENVGTKELKSILKNNISAFSGNSGVGKSTLINDILGENITQEGSISKKNQKGKNTTTQVSLYKVEKNTYVADTPGFGAFEISEIESKDLCHYFKEFVPYIQNCEFVGCSHIKEEKCGIKDAVQQGKIEQERYERYCKIYEKLKEKETKKW